MELRHKKMELKMACLKTVQADGDVACPKVQFSPVKLCASFVNVYFSY